MHDVASIRAKFETLRPYLDERRRRLWAAAEAMVLGRGGITAVGNATGLQRVTIRAGRPDVAVALDLQEHPPVGGRVGAAGAPGQPSDRGGLVARAGLQLARH